LRCIPYTLFPFSHLVLLYLAFRPRPHSWSNTPFASIVYLRAYHIHSLIAHIDDINTCVHTLVPFLSILSTHCFSSLRLCFYWHLFIYPVSFHFLNFCIGSISLCSSGLGIFCSLFSIGDL
jgi:hypothetical protein